MSETTARALREVPSTPNECDPNFEAANVCDALFFVGRCLLAVAQAIEGRTDILPAAGRQSERWEEPTLHKGKDMTPPFPVVAAYNRNGGK